MLLEWTLGKVPMVRAVQSAWPGSGPGWMRNDNPRRWRRAKRGFTLAELLAVVAIVGILAVIGIASLRHYIYTSKTTEVLAMVQSVRAAEERWRAENHGYLNVSTSLESWYPMATPGKTKYAWDQPSGNDYARWRLLNPTVTGPVQAGYAVRAGPPFTAIPAPSTAYQPPWPAAADQIEPWYLIQCAADTDGDGQRALYLASSLTGEIHMENEGE
jgi:type IV pilus assembly protein PilA